VTSGGDKDSATTKLNTGLIAIVAI